MLNRPSRRAWAPWLGLGLALSLGFAARSASADGAAPAGAAPPAAKSTRPARSASAGGTPSTEQANATFEQFASEWMAKMERVESENRSHPHPNAETGAALGYRGYSNDYKLEVKPTGSSQSPYVGIVRYSEQEYACTDKAATKCEISSTMPVTEIFRFQNGHWVY